MLSAAGRQPMIGWKTLKCTGSKGLIWNCSNSSIVVICWFLMQVADLALTE